MSSTTQFSDYYCESLKLEYAPLNMSVTSGLGFAGPWVTVPSFFKSIVHMASLFSELVTRISKMPFV